MNEPVTARFEGRVAIVTGSSRGIGRAIAGRLAGDGAAVVLNGRNRDELELAAKELRADGASVATVAADVVEVDTAGRLVDAAIREFGRVDLLVGNIGLSSYIGPTLDTDRPSFETMMLGNTWLTVGLLKAAMSAGMGSGSARVNLSAIGTRKIFPPAGVHTASKAAVDFLTKNLALELAPLGIRVNAVAPGLTKTPTTAFLLDDPELLAQQLKAVPLGRIGEPADIANAVTFLLSDEAAYITGVVLDVDGGALLSPAGFQGD
jgi:NAD(P)-dependent dehydrogenase (short-subunit alcohol dehydrogenase family)